MSTLTIKRKIDLFNKLYKEISGYGRGGDTELAHVNKYEAAALKAMGGSGTVNPTTGLREYGMFDKDDDPAPAPAPTTTTVKQVSDLPEYFKPYVEELFATAQDVYEKPYVPYEGKRLADVTEEQKAAFSGLQDLFTQVDPETGTRSFRDPTAAGYEEAARLRGRGAKGFDELGEGVFQETYMSPYTQAVTDIQTREAQKVQEQKRQERQGAARMANALGGSRYGVQEALTGGIDAQFLDDIRKKGLQEAYTQGLSTFEADRLAAARGAEQELTGTSKAFSDQLKGVGALQATGETQRAIAQQPLDVAYEEFARQQQFPKQNLQELSGILRGFNVQPSTYKTSQVYKQPPSLGSQLLAAGTLGAGISSGLGKSLLGTSSNAGGGLISVAPERYQRGWLVPERGHRELRDLTPIESVVESLGEWKDTVRRRSDQGPNIMGRGGLRDVEELDVGEIMEEYERDFGPQIAEQMETDELFVEDDLGPDEFDITTLDTTAIEPSPTEDLVTETTTDETIFDFGAALPWFKMAAEFGKAGQDTSEAAAAALEEFESTTSKRKMSKAQIALYEAQAMYNAARPDIEAAKRGKAITKEQKDRLIKIISKKLEILKDISVASVGGSKAYEAVIQKTIRDLEAVEGATISSTALPKRSVAASK